MNRFFVVILIGSMLTACNKKENEPTPTDHFDPTKFYIAGTNAGGSTSPGSNYVVLLRPGGVSTRFNYAAIHGPADGNYTYSGGHLKLNLYGGNDPAGIVDFTISGDAIATISSSWQNFANSTTLQKIPERDAFSGKKFRGWMRFYTTSFGNMDNVGFTFGTNGRFAGGIGTSTEASPRIFSLLNNGVAIGKFNDEEFYLFVMIGNTLTVSEIAPGRQTSFLGYGEFTEVK